ncbi:MAG: glycosyltransferase family 4 protein [Actinomycetota bacterium]
MTDRDGRSTVLFVVLAAGLGGSTRSVATVLAHLDPVRVRRVLSTPPYGRFLDLVNERGLADALVPLPANRGRFRRISRVWAAWRVAAWLWSNRPIAAIHVNGPEELNVVALAARVFRIRVVVWSHARGVSPWMRRLSWLWPHVLRDVTFAAVSPLARQVLVDGGLARTGDVEIVPNPIDPEDVVGVPDGHDGLVVGYLGSDAAYKGFQFLPAIIEAVEHLPVRWLVFADQHPSSDSVVWEKLNRLPAETVTVVGKVDNVREAYARCDVVLCPSLQESFCRVAAEAMLNGLPVVASDLEPLRDLLGEEEAGLLFPPGDVHAAAAMFGRLAADEHLMKRLGERGRERAGVFDPSAVTRRLAALYSVSIAPASPSSSGEDAIPVSSE